VSGYPRESEELVVFDDVLVNGVATIAYVWQLTPDHERPSMAPGDWSTPIDAGNGDLGFMLLPAARGTYRVWVKVEQGGQAIVLLAGELERT
jgi:hypothetical protein